MEPPNPLNERFTPNPKRAFLCVNDIIIFSMLMLIRNCNPVKALYFITGLINYHMLKQINF